MTAQRYAVELAYRGTAYSGWQRQPNALSVAETLDTALSTVLGESIQLVGCGRTDAGVHATDYVAHFDLEKELPPRLLGRLNRFLPADIALRKFVRMPQDFHARFDATGREYVYRISLSKDPFRPDTVSWLPALGTLDRGVMEEAASLLLQYDSFATFCKTNSDAFTMRCHLRHSYWTFGEDEWVYRIGANRFLRGMVRLIVGMCLQVGEGKLTVGQVSAALDSQRRLPRPLSAPPEGLFLSAVHYPDRTTWTGVTY